LVGGKAADLGELIQAEFPVPDDLCVTTAAYAQVATGADIEPLITALAEGPTGHPDHMPTIAGRIRKSARLPPVSADLAGAITTAYGALGPDVAMAVRSSATVEDLPAAAFAGQQDTFLMSSARTRYWRPSGAVGLRSGPIVPSLTARARGMISRQ
jgi:phosphoenolpyruvate synthase/pyruvate phosphate dikinase